MSQIDPYERGYRSHRSARDYEYRDDRDPRYVSEETYVRSAAPVAPEPPYAVRQTELVRRPHREDSDLSIEEVRREFPPPGSGFGRADRYGPPVRARSVERGYRAYDDPRRSYDDFDDRRSRKSQTYAEQEIVKPRRRSLSRNQKIIAGVGGAALALAGKELFDRKQADGRPVSRNALQSAAIAAAGGFAGYEGAEFYAKHAGKKDKEEVKTYVAHRNRNGEVAEYYSSDDETVKQPKQSRRKSIVEGALGLAGLGAATKAVAGSGKRRGSGDSHVSGRSRSRHGGHDKDKAPEGAAKFQQAAKAALLAGATEAFRVRKEPGGWGGDKGKRILTAAIGAGGIDAAADRDPDHKSKRHILEAVVGGLAGNRLINGSRSNVEDDGRSSRGGRSRSRSRAPGGGGGSGAGLAALATAGIGALAGKKLLDRSRSRDGRNDRSRSRGPGRRRGSPDSYDSRSPSPRRDRHKRSKSVSDYARKGLAAIGLGEAASEAGGRRDKDRDRDVEYEETKVHRSSRRRRSPDDDYEPRSSRGYRDDRDDRDEGYGSRGGGGVYDDPRYADSRSSNVGSTRNGGGRKSNRQKAGERDRRIAEGKQAGSDSSDLGSSTDDEKRMKKMKAPRY